MKLKKALLILSLVLCCAPFGAAGPYGPYGPPMVAEFDREQQSFSIRIVIHDTHEQVTLAKSLRFPRDKPQALLGWTTWDASGCEIHVSKAEYYDDPEFATWGHELAHCLYGNFHRELDAKMQ